MKGEKITLIIRNAAHQIKMSPLVSDGVHSPVKEEVGGLVHHSSSWSEDKVLRYGFKQAVVHADPAIAPTVEDIAGVVASSGHLAMVIHNYKGIRR